MLQNKSDTTINEQSSDNQTSNNSDSELKNKKRESLPSEDHSISRIEDDNISSKSFTLDARSSTPIAYQWSNQAENNTHDNKQNQVIWVDAQTQWGWLDNYNRVWCKEVEYTITKDSEREQNEVWTKCGVVHQHHTENSRNHTRQDGNNRNLNNTTKRRENWMWRKQAAC